jgi:hypothetical protein
VKAFLVDRKALVISHKKVMQSKENSGGKTKTRWPATSFHKVCEVLNFVGFTFSGDFTNLCGRPTRFCFPTAVFF